MALAGAAATVGFAHAGGGPLLTDSSRSTAAAISPTTASRWSNVPSICRPGRCRGHAPRRRVALASAGAGRRTCRAHVDASAQLAGARTPGNIRSPSTRRAAGPSSSGRSIASPTPPGARHAHGASRRPHRRPGDEASSSELAPRLAAAGVHDARLQGALDLVMLAAVLQQCQLLLTGDTGPMHLAAAVGTPVLAVFGPSMPWRYGPLIAHHRDRSHRPAVQPCNRIRQPPERCQGHTPDCLAECTSTPSWPRDGHCCAAARASGPGKRGERARRRDGLGSSDAVDLDRPARRRGRRAGRRRGQPLDQAAAARAGRWRSLRDRFLHRGDSLWWFAEIYLHRMRVVTRRAPGRRRARARWLGRIPARAGSSTAPTRWWVTSRTSSRRVTGSCATASCRRAAVPQLGHAREGVCFIPRRPGGSSAPRAGPARAALARGGVRALGVRGRPGGRRGLRRPDAPRARAAASRTASRWSGWDRARTSAPVAGAIGCRSSSNPQPRDIAATPVTSFAGWRTLAPSRAVWQARGRRPSRRSPVARTCARLP